MRHSTALLITWGMVFSAALSAQPPATSGDIIITEIMADPTPALGFLPEAEYVELYNKGPEAINLAGFSLKTNSAAVRLPEFMLPANGYLILCSRTNAAAFGKPDKTLGLSAFPALPNSGSVLTIQSPEGLTIEALHYSLDWYANPAKAAGGWALERLAADRPGNCPGNWQASSSPSGGTPGAPNSYSGPLPDKEGPTVLSAIPESPWEILVRFDEVLSDPDAGDPAFFQLDPDPGIIAANKEPNGPLVLLLLKTPLQAGRIYALSVRNGIRDCLGNPSLSVQVVQTGLAEPPQAGDVAVNEILFNPQTGGKDFIELFNVSGKIVNLEGLILENAQKTSGSIRTTIEEPFLLFPGHYVAITPEPADIRTRYPVPDSAVLLANPLPTFSPDEGNATLRSTTAVLDAFDYSDSYHLPLLTSTKGVSLERISAKAPARDPGNWHSAAGASGFATPGYRNSQFFPLDANTGEQLFQLPENTLSPDEDGYQDFLLLAYRTPAPGYLATIRIFDAQGRQVKELVGKTSLANEGLFKWDGSDEAGRKAPIGMYVIWIEYFRTDGTKGLQKLACVLASRF